MPHTGIDLVLTPAVVAGIVTFLLNQRNDGLRSRKDYHTKASDSVREAVREATELAAGYYSTKVSDRTETQEAMILVADRDIASAVPRVCSHAVSEELAPLVAAVKSDLINFLALLTGGSFQERQAVGGSDELDASHLRKLALASAKLRESISVLRDEQLSRSVLGYTLWRHSAPLRNWWVSQRGPVSDI